MSVEKYISWEISFMYTVQSKIFVGLNLRKKLQNSIFIFQEGIKENNYNVPYKGKFSHEIRENFMPQKFWIIQYYTITVS